MRPWFCGNSSGPDLRGELGGLEGKPGPTRRAQGGATARNCRLARNLSRLVVIYGSHGAAGRRMGEAGAATAPRFSRRKLSGETCGGGERPGVGKLGQRPPGRPRTAVQRVDSPRATEHYTARKAS